MKDKNLIEDGGNIFIAPFSYIFWMFLDINPFCSTYFTAFSRNTLPFFFFILWCILSFKGF